MKKNVIVSLADSNYFELLNEFTKGNIDKLNKAVKETSYDRYQKQVHRIQRDYYDILYQITLGGADKDLSLIHI